MYRTLPAVQAAISHYPPYTGLGGQASQYGIIHGGSFFDTLKSGL